MSRKRDWDKSHRNHRVRTRGTEPIGEMDPEANANPTGLAKKRGWTRPPVVDWRVEAEAWANRGRH